MSVRDLPTLNALFNLTSAVLLTLGYLHIKKGDREKHRRFMLAALGASVLFLTSYVVYHSQVGSVPYPRYDWTRPVYFAILIPHVILAALMTPFILFGVRHALKGRYQNHRRLMRWVWPVWMFVSISGVIVYVMLYQL